MLSSIIKAFYFTRDFLISYYVSVVLPPIASSFSPFVYMYLHRYLHITSLILLLIDNFASFVSTGVNI
jgi:hypothetical protein